MKLQPLKCHDFNIPLTSMTSCFVWLTEGHDPKHYVGRAHTFKSAFRGVVSIFMSRFMSPLVVRQSFCAGNVKETLLRTQLASYSVFIIRCVSRSVLEYGPQFDKVLEAKSTHTAHLKTALSATCTQQPQTAGISTFTATCPSICYRGKCVRLQMRRVKLIERRFARVKWINEPRRAIPLCPAWWPRTGILKRITAK